MRRGWGGASFFHAYASAETTVPARTALARSAYTVTAETRKMTKASILGILCSSRSDDHENVLWQTRSMMPTSAAIGTCKGRGVKGEV